MRRLIARNFSSFACVSCTACDIPARSALAMLEPPLPMPPSRSPANSLLRLRDLGSNLFDAMLHDADASSPPSVRVRCLCCSEIARRRSRFQRTCAELPAAGTITCAEVSSSPVAPPRHPLSLLSSSTREYSFIRVCDTTEGTLASSSFGAVPTHAHVISASVAEITVTTHARPAASESNFLIFQATRVSPGGMP